MGFWPRVIKVSDCLLGSVLCKLSVTLTCQIHCKRNEPMITHKELQRFLPLDECAEIISHCLAIKEVVHTNQEIPEMQGAFVSRSESIWVKDTYLTETVLSFNNTRPLSSALGKACRWGVLYARSRFQHGSGLCSSPVNHNFIYDKRWLVKRERVGVCLFIVECLYMNVKCINQWEGGKGGEIVRREALNSVLSAFYSPA